MRNRWLTKENTIKTNKASVLNASNGTPSNIEAGLYSSIRDEVSASAGKSFIKAGKYSLQGWVQVFECWQGSGISKNAFATVVDGMVFGDAVLVKSTLNAYMGIIEWALDYFDETLDEDSDSLTILSEFASMTELRSFKQSELGQKKSNDRPSKKSDPVEKIVKSLKSLSKAEQLKIRKEMGW